MLSMKSSKESKDMIKR